MSDFVHDACCLARKDHGADPGWASGPARPRWWPARAAWTLWALTLLGLAATAWLDRLLRCPCRQLPGRARQRRQHRLPVPRRRRCPGPGGIVGADHPDHTPVRPDLRSPGGGLLTAWLSGDRTAARKVSTRQLSSSSCSPSPHLPTGRQSSPADWPTLACMCVPTRWPSMLGCRSSRWVAPRLAMASAAWSSGTEDPSSGPSGPTGVKVEHPRPPASLGPSQLAGVAAGDERP